MSKESFIFILGVVVAVTPFLGIPGTWKQWVFIIAGVLIIVVGYQLRRASFIRSIETPHGERRADAFVESGTPSESTDFVTDTDERLHV